MPRRRSYCADDHDPDQGTQGLPMFAGTERHLHPGLQARDDAIEQVERGNADLVRRCREAMIALYRARAVDASPFVSPVFVSGDDASKWLDEQGFTGERRVIGAVFRPRSGWVSVGQVPSLLKRRHYRTITCWRWEGVKQEQGAA